MGKKLALKSKKNLKELQQQDRSKRSITVRLPASSDSDLSARKPGREIRERQESWHALTLAPVLKRIISELSVAQSQGKSRSSPVRQTSRLRSPRDKVRRLRTQACFDGNSKDRPGTSMITSLYGKDLGNIVVFRVRVEESSMR